MHAYYLLHEYEYGNEVRLFADIESARSAANAIIIENYDGASTKGDSSRLLAQKVVADMTDQTLSEKEDLVIDLGHPVWLTIGMRELEA